MNNVLEITSRQFREEQKKYFEMADNGTQIVITRGKKHSYVLTRLSSDDWCLKPEMLEKIEHSKERAKAGRLGN